MKIQNIQDLVEFKEIPYSEIQEKHKIKKASNNLFYADDLFGDEPETVFYYKGDIHIKESLILSDLPYEYGCFVIEGNIIINGVLAIEVSDMYNTLTIDGNLQCKNLLLSGEAFLSVLKDTEVENLFYNNISDGGGAIFHNKIVAKSFFNQANAHLEMKNKDNKIGEDISSEEMSTKHEIKEDLNFEQIVVKLQ
ncbi:hypothetical protein [Aquimarina litoralis]|uniref:hypothetical protein n=1 Tax=Aquimarina litoralis TaxID=584605 RepID=UPI001C59BD63|nr:hypothetical protein [Aquimarina litoralis]MBW1298475.1 hypothetical protein [Aquimarina litoralis]